jgi:hypothetical protein
MKKLFSPGSLTELLSKASSSSASQSKEDVLKSPEIRQVSIKEARENLKLNRLNYDAKSSKIFRRYLVWKILEGMRFKKKSISTNILYCAKFL